MKKVAVLALICVLVISLTGCNDRYYYSDSLEHYVEIVMRSNIGNSSAGIDDPDVFLPSQRFLVDFEYTSGIYRWYESDAFNYDSTYPLVALLVLKYSDDVYFDAKENMLANIPNAEGDTIYEYGDYKFYRNKNYLDYFAGHPPQHQPTFPYAFTMACYNDTQNILCFISLGGGAVFYGRYEDPLSEWKDFIDSFYGRFYNFETHEVQEVVNPEKW